MSVGAPLIHQLTALMLPLEMLFVIVVAILSFLDPIQGEPSAPHCARERLSWSAHGLSAASCSI